MTGTDAPVESDRDEKPDSLNGIVRRAANRAQSDVQMFGIVAVEILHKKVLAPRHSRRRHD
jgi:hypothetical protein